ncbi:GMC family oxidoreductase [Aspergillus mulundensis]|uniref:glucose oxidase n=1 Tax=Aspergillus mulundensis TaxID=1810919 RepID=A0A3D8SUP1_9EURO|nr:Uncharacterized protein DSM5745_01759 [Aspergillus mulundensis]RDW89984.1 Uncharacterized protein DSM5745_01759 [Aspergillus mulundensis]
MHHKILAALTYTFYTIPAISCQTLPSSLQDTFDFIIVGGGTAGLAVANRLSEIAELTIAVIEAGQDEGDNPNVTSVKTFGASPGLNSHIDWVYQTTPEGNADNRQMEYHAGRAWGGTSVINGMTYIRAEASQIDAWETAGNENWTWASLWPYHLKSESFSPPTPAQTAAGASFIDSYHGDSGPVQVSYQYGLQNGSFASRVKQTWQNLDVPFNPDVNGGVLRGFFVWPQTLIREENVRCDAARAYYYPVRERGNLAMLQGKVRRILWADDDNDMNEKGASLTRAQGVEYTASNGDIATLYAKREVILSAGSIRSPAILELSGVGNPEILEPLNITTKIPLPAVGENAIDQPNNFIAYASNLTFTGFVPYVTYLSASDIFGSDIDTVADETSAQLPLWAAQTANTTHSAISAASLEQLYRIQHSLIFNQDVPLIEILTTGIGSNVGSAFFILLPFSRGNVHITSSNPHVYPSINPNYLNITWDAEVQVRSAEIVRRFWGMEPVSSLVGERVQPSMQDVPANATGAEWEGWIRGSFTPNHHLVGTAAMLPKELGGVVDRNLLVYGTENVRVIDASILPAQISGHLTSIVYAVAERAADIIKAEYGL